VTAIWGTPSLFLEVGKMGMIAFYAGLFIGVLLGFLLLSLMAFFLASGQAAGTPDQTKGYSQADPLEP
jgi:predicted lipid-binding transport protein (Tim44 family)